MTPTLLGRWQTRLLLFIVIALPVTLLYSLFLTDWTWPPLTEPFVFVIALLVVGWVLDIFYIQIQRFRWDNDWPFAFQFFFSFVEFLIVFGIMAFGLLDPWLGFRIPFSTAFIMFLWIFVPSFLALLGGVQLFYIRWRFKGGELGRHPI